MKTTKNKRGFSLVELLAVLVILAILIILIGSTILRIIDKAEENVTASQEKAILGAAEKWSIDNSHKFDDIEATKIQVGLDIVFILDISTSMNSAVTGSSLKRFIAMTDAVNSAMEILEGENNRQAIYMYSTYFYTFLPLASYSSSDNIYITTTNRTSSYGSNPIKTSPTLKKNGVAVAAKSQTLVGSTNTQKGIVQGTQLLLNTPAAEAANRIPVVILLTDGQPNYSDATLCKSCNISEKSALGITYNHYYYALMAGYESKANLAKHYTNSSEVFFYTIGLGISSTNEQVNKILNPAAYPETQKYAYPTKAFINDNMTAEDLKNIFKDISVEVTEATKVTQVCVTVKDLYDGGYLSTDDIEMAGGEAASTYVIMNFNEATKQYNFALAKTAKQEEDCKKLLEEAE